MVKRLTDDNFKKETSNGLSLVAFIAPWCPYLRASSTRHRRA